MFVEIRERKIAPWRIASPPTNCPWVRVRVMVRMGAIFRGTIFKGIIFRVPQKFTKVKLAQGEQVKGRCVFKTVKCVEGSSWRKVNQSRRDVEVYLGSKIMTSIKSLFFVKLLFQTYISTKAENWKQNRTKERTFNVQ